MSGIVPPSLRLIFISISLVPKRAWRRGDFFVTGLPRRARGIRRALFPEVHTPTFSVSCELPSPYFSALVASRHRKTDDGHGGEGNKGLLDRRSGLWLPNHR
jgi:hypothetical protein